MNLHSANRRTLVSIVCLHKEHVGLCDHPRLANRSEDQTRFWSINHAKNLHFGGIHVYRIDHRVGVVVQPINCTLYADAVEYSLFAVTFHLIVSGWCCCRPVSCSKVQSWTNSLRCVVVSHILLRSSRIQLLFCRASATVRCFFFERLYKFGVISLGLNAINLF